MIDQIIDNTPQKTLSLLIDVYKRVLDEQSREFEKFYGTIFNSRHFFLRLRDSNGMKYLDLVEEESIQEVGAKLLSAFAQMGTRETIIDILRSIFGSEGQITIDENPGEVNIQLSGFQQLFLANLVTDDPANLVTDDPANIIIEDFEALQETNISDFVGLFIPGGVRYTVSLI